MTNDQPKTSCQGNAKEPIKGGQQVSDSKAKDSKKLSPEEQMAAYEEDLKEGDWGHQPC